jgi:hypothetical protein
MNMTCWTGEIGIEIEIEDDGDGDGEVWQVGQGRAGLSWGNFCWAIAVARAMWLL